VGAQLGSGLFGLVILLAAWVVTRAVLMAETFSGEMATDVVAYARWAGGLSEGVAPATDTAFVYPPGSVAIFWGIDLLGGSYYRVFTLAALLADFVILALLWTRVRQRDTRLVAAPWAWVVMGFAAGPLLYQRYDIFSALFGVLAVLALSKPVRAGIWSGLGMIVKLWPEIALLGLSRRNIWKGLAASLVTVAVSWGALHLLWGDSFGFVGNVLNKGLSVEAIVAYPFLVMRALGSSHVVTGQFGSWEVVGPGVEMAATATTVLGVLVLGALFILRLMGRLDHASPGDIVLLGVLAFVATHKINSLQYGVWIAVIAAAALTFEKSRALGPAILLTLMLVVADQVVWDNFVSFISGNPLMLGYQGVRLVLLLVAAGWLGWSVLSPDRLAYQDRNGFSLSRGTPE
jgi:hypothetical protein